MFKCDQSDWKECFQAWSVVYCFASILIAVIFLGLRCLSYLSYFNLPAIVVDVISSVVAIVICFIFAHLDWFCVVRRDGCCGSLGYLIWAIVYILIPCGPMYFGGAVGLIYLAMLVPVVYMALASFKLMQGSREPLIAS